MLIWVDDAPRKMALAEWALSQIPHMAGGQLYGDFVAAAVLRDGDLAAGVFFHDWQPSAGTMQVSMAAATPRWASREVLRDLYGYAFRTAGAAKLWAASPHANARAIRFLEGTGMKREATLRHHFGPQSHAVVCSMLRKEWARSRWGNG